LVLNYSARMNTDPRVDDSPVPADLREALASNAKASRAFDAFAPSHQREYIQWIQEAKRDETRRRRIGEAIKMIAAGKSRNWKYGG
jgi:uncharacterized protein YdeI (YjbR/CyaY-like superfamily)